jgi:hypothetical protein
VRVFSGAKSSLAAAARQAAALPTSSLNAFKPAALRVVTTIRGSLTAMSSVTPARNAQLHTAAAKDPTCQRLASGG